MKHTLLPILASIALMPTACLQAQMQDDVDRIVAIVGDTVITSYDVKQKIAPQLKQLELSYSGQDLQDKRQKACQEAADAMVCKELIYLDFKALKAELPAHIVQERLDRAISTVAGGDVIKFEETLYDQGMTMAEFKEKIHKEIATEILLRNKVKLGISIPDGAIEDFYNRHKFEMAKPSRYHLGVILIKPDGRNKGKVDATIRTIQQEIKRKTPFATLAKNYSDGPNPDQGGDLGWMDSPAKALLDAVRNLDKGQTTPAPFKIGQNHYFAHIIDMTGGGVPILDATLKEAIRKKLATGEEKKKYADYLKELHMKFPVRRMDDGINY